MTSTLRATAVTASLLLLIACGGGDGDGGSNGAADSEPVCAPPVGTYLTEARSGKGTCDRDLIFDQLLPLEDVVIEEGESCGPFAVATYNLSDACNGIGEFSVVMTDDGPTDGRVDVTASDCSDGGGECTYAFPVELTLEGGRP